MNWNANIEKVSNGYIMEVETDDGEGPPLTSTLVFEEADSYDDMEERKAELDAFVKMVWELADYFAVSNSKHEKYNLRIEVEDERCEDNPD
jgi:hypothetical protein